MNGLIYMYNPTTINGILRQTIITIIDIRYLLVSLVVWSGLFIYATFSITQSQYFFLISVRDYRTCILCIVWDINGVYLIHTLITAFYFCNIVELICSILSHPHKNYFFYLHIIYFLQVCFGTAVYCGSKINIARTKSIKCEQLVMSVSVTFMVSMWEKWRSPWQPKQVPGSPACRIE